MPPPTALFRPFLLCSTIPLALPRQLRCLRPFTSSPLSLAKPLPPRRQIPDDEIIENFLKGSGPGGQKINKTSSAVQLKHIPTGVVVKSQETRSRTQNRKIARRLLAERIEELELGEDSRTAFKAREKSRKKASADKKKRRKYRTLAETKDEGDVEESEEQPQITAESGEVTIGGTEGSSADDTIKKG